MASRETEKLEKTRRRLAAVSFLTNISLDGTYKDTGWWLEHARQESGAFHDAPNDLEKGNDKDDEGQSALIIRPVENVSLILGDSSNLKDWKETQIEIEPDLVPERKRANTTIGGADPITLTRGRRAHLKETEAIQQPFPLIHQKHAHFSSSESVETTTTVPTGSVKFVTNAPEVASNRPKVRYYRSADMRSDPPPVIGDERCVIMVGRRAPVLVFSRIPYSRTPRAISKVIEKTDQIKRTRNASGSRPISALSDGDPLEQLVHKSDEEVSYGHLLQPTHPPTIKQKSCDNHIDVVDSIKKHPLVSRCVSYDAAAKLQGTTFTPATIGDNFESDEAPRLVNPYAPRTNSIVNPPANANTLGTNAAIPYSPELLDPEFRAGRHRTVLSFQTYITSVIDYCKAADMKKELNDKFRDRFPNIQLTLSKLRSLKREIKQVARTECQIDLLTVAQAYVYFEKLILASFVTKFNRKYCAGACLLLSAKMNDIKGENLHNLIEKIENTFRVDKEDLLSFEFAVLVALEFALHIPACEVFPHYQRLLYQS